MGSNRIAVVAAVLIGIGCGPTASVGGDTSETTESTGSTAGTDGGDTQAGLCESVLDASVYTLPAWSPDPLVEDETCPRVEGAIQLALPEPVVVSGVTRIEGQPAKATVVLKRRSDDSGVQGESEEDGTFEFRALPGRYDVYFVNPQVDHGASALILEDVDLTEPTQLQLDAPPVYTLSGTITMDGEPGDLFGYVLISEQDSRNSADLLARMYDGNYEIRVGAGTYEFLYTWCDYTVWQPPESPIFCISGQGLPDIPEDAPRIGPVQFSVPFLDGIVVDEDQQLDIDVPTAELSGTILVDGEPPVEGSVQARPGGGVGGGPFSSLFGGEPDVDGRFGGRVVAGTYDLHFTDGSGPLAAELSVEQDTEVDLEVHTARLRGAFPSEDPIIPSSSDWSVTLDRLDDRETLWIEAPPSSFELQVFEGPYSMSHSAPWCWPDHMNGNVSVHQRFPAFDASGDLELELGPSNVARVHVRISDPTGATPGAFLFPVGDDHPAGHVYLSLDEGELDAHGVMVPGRYRLAYGGTNTSLGELEVVDGVTITAELESAAPVIELTVGGETVDATDHVYFIHEGGDSAGLYHDDIVVPPDRYRLVYHRKSNDDVVFPDNSSVDMGCVTLGAR